MNIFRRIKNWFNNIKQQYKVAKEDKQNRKLFIDSVKAELRDRTGFFAQYNIKIDNDNYTQIVYPISIPIEFQTAGQDWQIKDKLDENSYIVSRFLRTKWGYSDNISGPEYYHLEDPTDNNVSTRYIAIWNFVNQLESKKTIYIINTIIAIIAISIIGGLFLLI